MRRMGVLGLLACTGCFGARVSAGPVLDTRGNVGADAVLLFSMDVPVANATAIELVGGGGGGITNDRVSDVAGHGVSPVGTVQSGIGVVHMEERYGLRLGALASFQANEAYLLGGYGGWIGMPILLSSSKSRLFGSEEKGFGTSKSFSCIGPELDVQYTFARPALSQEGGQGGLSLSPRFVAELHDWTLF